MSRSPGAAGGSVILFRLLGDHPGLNTPTSTSRRTPVFSRRVRPTSHLAAYRHIPGHRNAEKTPSASSPGGLLHARQTPGWYSFSGCAGRFETTPHFAVKKNSQHPSKVHRYSARTGSPSPGDSRERSAWMLCAQTYSCPNGRLPHPHHKGIAAVAQFVQGRRASARRNRWRVR
jgi:hypothetical protein